MYHACHREELETILGDQELKLLSEWSLKLPKHGLWDAPGIWTGLNYFHSGNYYGPFLISLPLAVLNGRHFMVFRREGDDRNRYFFVQYEARIPIYSFEKTLWRSVKPTSYFQSVDDGYAMKPGAIYDIVLTEPMGIDDVKIEAVKHPYCISKQCSGLTRSDGQEILQEIAEDRENIMHYRNVRRATPDRYIAGGDLSTARKYGSISKNWQKLKNHPCAIAAYRESIREFPNERFAVIEAWYQMGLLYQRRGQFYRAINAYDQLIQNFERSARRLEGLYQQAICYRAIWEYRKAYENVKAYIKTNYPETKYFQEAQQIVQQMERDTDGDGYMFYQEQEARTSDQDANDYPRSFQR
ncbi:tetratricopeptide repeat protein [Candidatus Poribacteria bacterium]|nr:tetratricopeptide repeat protein [Candidatus Poribacteria bacterium]